MPPPNYCVGEQRYFKDEADRLEYNRQRTKKHSTLFIGVNTSDFISGYKITKL